MPSENISNTIPPANNIIHVLISRLTATEPRSRESDNFLDVGSSVFDDLSASSDMIS